MGNPAYGGWSYRGYAYRNQASVTNVRTLHALTRDATNEPRSSYVGNDCAIMSVEVYLDTMNGVGANPTLTVSIWRDAAGDLMLVGEDTVNIVIGTTTGTDGTARITYDPEIDHHRTSFSVDGDSDMNVTLYVGLQLNAGTANANVVCNWASAVGA